METNAWRNSNTTGWQRSRYLTQLIGNDSNQIKINRIAKWMMVSLLLSLVKANERNMHIRERLITATSHRHLAEPQKFLLPKLAHLDSMLNQRQLPVSLVVSAHLILIRVQHSSSVYEDCSTFAYLARSLFLEDKHSIS